MYLLRFLLWPFAVMYGCIMRFRNWLYNKGYKKIHSFKLPVISVGNLTVGGTGKTPHVEYLIRLLKDHLPLATLSRGYGRQTSGCIIANEQASATSIGDEPMQFYRKFGHQVQVVVGEKRVEAIEQIIRSYPQTACVLLDDAFQHRAVRPSFSILLSDYHLPFYRDYILPAGRLRESRKGAKRANCIIVSKCPPHLPESERESISREIGRYSRPDTPVYFTAIRYSQPVPFQKGTPFSARVLLVTGLANPAPLEAYVKSAYGLAHHMVFNDHHAYTPEDVSQIQKSMAYYRADVIVTTEKDYVKLSQPAFAGLVAALPFFYLPIEVYFLFGQGQDFDKNLWKAITHTKTNY